MDLPQLLIPEQEPINVVISFDVCIFMLMYVSGWKAVKVRRFVYATQLTERVQTYASCHKNSIIKWPRFNRLQIAHGLYLYLGLHYGRQLSHDRLESGVVQLVPA